MPVDIDLYDFRRFCLHKCFDLTVHYSFYVVVAVVVGDLIFLSGVGSW